MIQGQMKYYIISMEQVSMETHLCCYKFTAAQRDYNENWILSKRKFKELDYRTKMTLHGVFGHNKRLYNPHNYFHIFKKMSKHTSNNNNNTTFPFNIDKYIYTSVFYIQRGTYDVYITYIYNIGTCVIVHVYTHVLTVQVSHGLTCKGYHYERVTGHLIF